MKNSNWIIISIVALVALTGILAITNVNNQGHSYGIVTNPAVNKNNFRLNPQQQSLPKSSLSKSYEATGYSVDSGGASGGAECYFNSDCDSLYPNQCKKCSFGTCVDKCSSSEVCNYGSCEPEPECYSNYDCNYYDCEKCSNGNCVSKCSYSQICNDGRCEAEPDCYSNSDCSYYDCEKCSNGNCVSKCSSSQVCNSGVCAECATNADCSYYDCEQCSNGKCVSKCDSTQICNDGTCEIKPDCYADSDCSSSACEECSNGKCVYKCSSSQVCNSGVCAECSSDFDCSSSACEECSNGNCISKCDSTQVCNDGTCELKKLENGRRCSIDSDCLSGYCGQSVSGSEKVCQEPDCLSNSDCSYYDCEQCSNGKCVSKCDSTQICNDGTCEIKPNCYTDSDCSYYDCEKCSNGECVDKCGTGFVCNDGTCEIKPDCYADSDCSSSACQECSNGKCVYKCSSSQVCNSGVCAECSSDFDCSSSACEKCISGKCVNKCSSTQVCNDGTCELKKLENGHRCSTSNDCLSGYCGQSISGSENVCREPECLTNSDCPPYSCLECLSGKCVSKCDEGFFCNDFRCEPKPDCYTSLDCNYYDCEKCSYGKCVNKCGTGFVCNDGKCTFKVSDWFNSIFGKLANGKRCSTDANCASGYCGQSVNGPEKVCQEPLLANGRRCNIDNDCLSGFCGQSSSGPEKVCQKPKKETGQRCYRDSDCLSGLCGLSDTGNERVCKNPSEGGVCSSNADCPSGLTCAAGKCTSVTHLDVYIRTKCNTSGDCSYYDCQYCNNGYCDSKCGADQTCDDGHCAVSDACQPNCPSDYECGNNGCGGSCGTCSLGYVCDYDHKCKKDVGRRCSTDADCLSGYSCESYDGGPEKVCKENEDSCSIYIDGKCINQTIPPHTNEVCNPKCELPSVCYNGECIGPCKSGDNYHELVVFDDNGNFVESRKDGTLITFAATGTYTCYVQNTCNCDKKSNDICIDGECISAGYPTPGSSICFRLPVTHDGGYTVYDLSGHGIASGEFDSDGTAIWDGRCHNSHYCNDGDQMANGGYIFVMGGKDANNNFYSKKGTVFIDKDKVGPTECPPISTDGTDSSDPPPGPTGKTRCEDGFLEIEYNDGIGGTYWNYDHNDDSTTKKPCNSCTSGDGVCLQYDSNGALTRYVTGCVENGYSSTYHKVTWKVQTPLCNPNTNMCQYIYYDCDPEQSCGPIEIDGKTSIRCLDKPDPCGNWDVSSNCPDPKCDGDDSLSGAYCKNNNGVAECSYSKETQCSYGCDSKTGKCKQDPCNNWDVSSNCKDPICSGGNSLSGAYCKNNNGVAECSYSKETQCSYGCDSKTGKCKQDPCNNWDVSLHCSDPICSGGNSLSGAYCKNNNGVAECSYSKETQCSYGCDSTTGICKPAPVDPCDNWDVSSNCKDPKCDGGNSLSGAYCKNNNGVAECSYSKETQCSDGCDSKTGKCKPAPADPCDNWDVSSNCPDPKCDGGNSLSGAYCKNNNGVAECSYSKETQCSDGCDSKTGKCKPAPADPCDNWDVSSNCPDPKCDGDNSLSGASCVNNNGVAECSYSTTTPCSYGCDSTTGICKSAPADPCDNWDVSNNCPDPKCDGDNSLSGASCINNNGIAECSYSTTTPCSYGCDSTTGICKQAPPPPDPCNGWDVSNNCPDPKCDGDNSLSGASCINNNGVAECSYDDTEHCDDGCVSQTGECFQWGPMDGPTEKFTCDSYCKRIGYSFGNCELRLKCPKDTFPVNFKCGGFFSWLNKCCCEG